MQNDVLKELQKPLIEALQELHRPVETLSLIALAGEFYTREERTELYKRYGALVEADDQAYNEVKAAEPKDKLGFEEREERFGKKIAD